MPRGLRDFSPDKSRDRNDSAQNVIPSERGTSDEESQPIKLTISRHPDLWSGFCRNDRVLQVLLASLMMSVIPSEQSDEESLLITLNIII